MARRKPATPPAPGPFALLRVRDAETGHEYTTRRLTVDANPDRYAVLDKPAADRQGRPLPPKPRILQTSGPEPEGAADQAADIPVTA